MLEILAAREERAKHILSLTKQFKDQTIVILKLNTPGNDKNLVKLKFIYNIYHTMMLNEFQAKILKTAKVKSLDGDYFYYVLDEEGLKVKAATILLEEAKTIGKLVDLDVYDNEAISRTHLGYQSRKCFICNNDAHLCVRSKAHALQIVLAKVDLTIKEYLLEDILAKTAKAINKELKLYPKFGLVTTQNNGCHLDMDYELFLKSTKAIMPFLKGFILYGLNDSKDLTKLKELGQEAEQAMFEATGNINTQKGLIFLMGSFLPTVTRAILHDAKIPFIKSEIKRISEEIIGNYYTRIETKKHKSHGDLIYLKYHLKGIRGEALNGLETIFHTPETLKKETPYLEMEYFIYLMSVLDDTTIIHRNNLTTLKNVKATMKEIVVSGGYTNNIEKVNKLSEEYLQKNISPGGASDMLVIKLLFEDLATTYYLK